MTERTLASQPVGQQVLNLSAGGVVKAGLRPPSYVKKVIAQEGQRAVMLEARNPDSNGQCKA